MVYNSLYYIVVIACSILNCLCFGQVLLIENESDVSQNNRAENRRNDDFYVAYEREDSSESRYNKPDAVLIDLLYNLGLRSQTPFNLLIHENNYGKKNQRHIKGNKIHLHRGDVILHNNIYSIKPKTNVQVGSGKKPSKKGKPKKPSKKGETNDKPSGLEISPGVDDVVKIAADLYEKILQLNEHDESKIDGITIHNRGKHQNTNDDDHDHDHEPHDHEAHDDGPHDHGPHDDGPHDHGPHDQGPHEHQPYDQKPHDQDDENDSLFDSIKKWIKEIQANDKTKHKKANNDDNLMPKIDLGKGEDEIDLLFHEITAATSTILDLVQKLEFNNNGCTEIERSAKYIAALAENKCMVS